MKKFVVVVLAAVGLISIGIGYEMMDFLNKFTEKEVCHNSSDTECINYYNNRCYRGDYMSCFLVGSYYLSQQDFANARKQFENVCKIKTSIPFQIILMNGARETIDMGLQKELKGASCMIVGEMYYEGKGVRLDKQKAKEYSQIACDFKAPRVCIIMSLFYLDEEKFDIAKEYAGKAYDLGQEEGCQMYAMTEGAIDSIKRKKEMKEVMEYYDETEGDYREYYDGD